LTAAVIANEQAHDCLTKENMAVATMISINFLLCSMIVLKTLLSAEIFVNYWFRQTAVLMSRTLFSFSETNQNHKLFQAFIDVHVTEQKTKKFL